jgi:type VI secretion system ImpA/VasJ family protein
VTSPLPRTLVTALTPPATLTLQKEPKDARQWPDLTNAYEQRHWAEALRLSIELQEECGWDARLIEHATTSLLHLHTAEGWLFGMRLWEELVRERWEQLPPARVAVRRSAALRYATKVMEWLLDVRSRPEPTASLKSLAQGVLRPLQAAFQSREIDDNGALIRAMDVVDEWADAPPQPIPEPVVASSSSIAAPPADTAPQSVQSAGSVPAASSSAQTSTTTQAAASGGTTTSSISSGTTETKSGTGGGQVVAAAKDATPSQVRTGFQNQRKAVLALLEQVRSLDPSAPFPYRIARDWAWAYGEQPKITDATRGLTDLPSPPQSKAKELSAILSSGDWAAVLGLAERSWHQALLWLDPHHASAQALRHLGHSDAAAVVEQAVLAYTARIPALLTLKYVDGTPLASAATVSWIEELQAHHGRQDAQTRRQGQSDDSTPAAAPQAPPIAPPPPAASMPIHSGAQSTPGLFNEALGTPEAAPPKSGQPATLGELAQAVSHAPTAREQFRLKLRFTELLMGVPAGEGAARALLDELDDAAQTHKIEVWEPPLFVELLRLQLTLAKTERPPIPDVLRRLQRRAAQLGAVHLLLDQRSER